MVSRKAIGDRPRPPGHVTLRDVAEAAGVSPMTVSNFINARHGTMRPETRARIETEIERLGYRPHTMARNLRLANRLSIGMVIVDEAPHYLADPVHHPCRRRPLQPAELATAMALQMQGLAADAFMVSPLDPRHPHRRHLHHALRSDSTRRGIVETLLAARPTAPRLPGDAQVRRAPTSASSARPIATAAAWWRRRC